LTKYTKVSDPVPRVNYTKEEVAIWKHVYNKLKSTHKEGASEIYKRNFYEMEKLGLIGENFIP